jgi:hypothetical protein
MQILNTKYSVGTSNWKARTPLMLKFICDVLLFISIAIALMPEISTPVGKWILFGGAVAKLLSNFISEHMPVSVQEQIKDNPIEPIKKE